MSDTGNISGSTNIGRVNVALEVTGVKEANATLDAFAAKAKSIGAAGGSSFAGGSSISGFTTSGHAPSVAGFSSSMSAPAAAVTAIGNAAVTASTNTQILGASLTTLLGRLVGIGSVVHVFQRLANAVMTASNASAELNDQIKDIQEGYKINGQVGLSAYEQMIDGANKYFKKSQDGLEKESRGWDEVYGKMALTHDEWLKQVNDQEKKGIHSAEFVAKREAIDQKLKEDTQEAIAVEKKKSDLQAQSIERNIALEKARTNSEKMALQERFALEDEIRSEAKSDEAKKDAELQASYARRRELIKEEYRLKRENANRQEAESIREFNNAGARSSLSRFGPGSNDQNTLILQNIAQTNRYLVAASRRF